jgi:hypothetical protein
MLAGNVRHGAEEPDRVRPGRMAPASGGVLNLREDALDFDVA